MQAEQLLKIVSQEMDDRKGENVTVLDVREKTSFTDYMVVVTGTSNRHLHALSDYVCSKAEESGAQVLGVEGGQGSDWLLVDLGDVIVHLMSAQARDLYQLEKLWSVSSPKEVSQQAV
jgi:ribosome-associated protein